MWWTPDGDRVLQGAEWELFRQGLACLWDSVEESFNDPGALASGVAVFDSLQPSQQLAMLALVGEALRDSTVPAPVLTAHTEGAIAAVYRHISMMIEFEIDRETDPCDEDSPTFWRELVLGAANQDDEDWEEPLPDVSCDDIGEWDFVLECVSDRIFWDADYEMDKTFLDAPPPRRRVVMEQMGIDPDYFLAVAPDPTEEQLGQIRGVLRQLAEPEQGTDT